MKSAAELVEQYFKLKDHIEARTNALSEELKPYKAGMELIHNQLLALSNLEGVDSLKTDFGTAYKSTIMSPKIVDQDKFLQWTQDFWQDCGKDTLRVAANVDGVKQWMQANADAPPPGIEISFNTRLNLRRS